MIIIELNKTLNIPAKYLFDILSESIIDDISAHIGQSISEEDLTGFEYEKIIGNKHRINIRIENFTRNKHYYYSTHSEQNTILVKYDVISLSDSICELQYSEQMQSDSLIQKINNKVVGLVWNKSKKKSFIESLEQFEKTYTKT